MAEQKDGPEPALDAAVPEPESTERVEGPNENEGAALIRARPKKKKRAIDAVPEPIRDRNKRLREEMAGKRGRRDVPRSPTRSLQAGEMVDDAFARSSQAAGEWLKKNFKVVQWVVLALIVGWISYAVYSYRAGRNAQQLSAKLTEAVRAEDGRIGSDDSKPDPQTGIVDTRAAYATDGARLQAAEKQYRAVADASPHASAAAYAKLGLASVLYDQGKLADAKASYQSVKDSKLASQDANVKGRALEGLGMCLEGLGDTAAAEKSFGELANLNGYGFGALGSYHKARLSLAAGNADKAKELLKDAQKQLDAGADKGAKEGGALPPSPSYLEVSVHELLRRIDPNAANPASNSLTAEQLQQLEQQVGASSGPDGKGVSQEQLKELLKQLSKPSASSSNPAPPASAP